jgi:hypothetical protein
MFRVQNGVAKNNRVINCSLKGGIMGLIWPSPNGEGADSPPVKGRCRQSRQRGTGLSDLRNGGGRGEKIL